MPTEILISVCFTFVAMRCFSLKFLDGAKQLSPSSECGCNFFHYAEKIQKSVVAVNGMRTDIEVCVDRKHPESLVPSIPCNIVFDTMHGLTRIVEKHFSLEIEKFLSE